MKKLILALSFLAIFSCSHNDCNVTLKTQKVSHEPLNVGDGTPIEIIIIDNRSDKEIIGIKELGEERINITSSQNLEKIIKDSMSEALIAQGFIIKSAGNSHKVITMVLKDLEYESSRGFPSGKTKSYSFVKVKVKNIKTGKRFYKNYKLGFTKKYLITSSQSNDKDNINDLLNQSLDQIISDQKFISKLLD